MDKQFGMEGSGRNTRKEKLDQKTKDLSYTEKTKVKKQSKTIKLT